MSESPRDTIPETRGEPPSQPTVEGVAAVTDPVAEAERAPFRSPREIVLLVMLLLILLLIAVATGRGLLIRPGTASGTGGALPIPTRISGTPQAVITNSGNGPNVMAGGQPICSPPGGPQQVSARFRGYYDRYGGLEIFGRPISPELLINGRSSQWYERALLQHWAELTPPYDVQPALIGVLFTQGIQFPKQAPFVSRPGLRYFAETGHGVRDPFLSFWEQRGGLMIFGYPISDEVQERLPEDLSNQTHTVQYFERVRLELHTEQSASVVRIGLLGSALCLANSKPNITNIQQPTPVPVP